MHGVTKYSVAIIAEGEQIRNELQGNTQNDRGCNKTADEGCSPSTTRQNNNMKVFFCFFFSNVVRNAWQHPKSIVNKIRKINLYKKKITKEMRKQMRQRQTIKSWIRIRATLIGPYRGLCLNRRPKRNDRWTQQSVRLCIFECRLWHILISFSFHHRRYAVAVDFPFDCGICLTYFSIEHASSETMMETIRVKKLWEKWLDDV